MKNKKKPGRFAITLIYSLIIFVILSITMIIVSIVFVILVHLGVFINIFALSMSNIILLLGLTSVIIGTIITIVTSRIPLHPVNNIINTMNELADGNFSARASLGKIHALKEVEDSINTMAAELEHTEMLRSDFINNFSHEFKTPIMSIAGFANLIRTQQLPDDKRNEYLEIIEDESLRLAKIATQVLNLTKLENQQILTNVSEFNVSEQLRTSVLMLEKKWSEKNIDIEIMLEEYLIEGNEEMLKQVWLNIIDNAVKFTPEYGTVRICANQNENETVISIFNSGSYIPEDERKKIFSKFYQSDTSHASEGNGIGLASVKKIIELHKGEITASSDENGTEFIIKLKR